jgi:acetyl esterase/lipase
MMHRPTRLRSIPWLAALFACLPAVGATEEIAPPEIPLWPDGAPGAMGEADADKPGLRVYQPAKPNGCAVVVCPGGGYGVLAYDHEGHQVAKWFNTFGVTAAVLKYRHAPYRHPIPLGDAQRVVRHLRANAEPLGIAADRIGIMGFSAGGHLASTAATHFDAGAAEAKDAVDRVSCRPDFCVLAYPVITMSEDFTHGGSIRNLLGENPTAELLDLLSNEKQVTRETPPTFLFHTADDRAVPVRNSLAFFAACQQHGVPSELHVYQHGPHGVGLAPGDPVLRTWPDRLRDWLRQNELLAEIERSVSVSGTVALDGEPLRWGQIAFVPADDRLPTATAMIARGKYALDAPHAPAVGRHTVEVTNLGDVVPRPTLADSKPLEPRDAQVEIVVGKQVLDFNLRSE